MKKHLLFFILLIATASLFADPLEDDLLENFESENTNNQNAVTSDFQSDEIDANTDSSEWDYYAEEFYPEGLIEDSEPRFAITNNRVFNPHRVFEVGNKTEVGVSNNYFTPGMILVENLVIDLRKIADELPYNGLQFNLLVSPNFFFNLNLPNGFHLGFTSGVEFTSNFGIGKGLFDFLGYGNATFESILLDMNSYADAFSHFDLAVGLDLFDGYHIEVQPSLFLPLAHVTTEGSYAKITNSDDGKILFEGITKANIYAITDVQKLIESGNPSLILSDLTSGYGFDFTTSVDKKIFDFLTVQAYSRIPVLPGRLKYNTSFTTSVSGKFEGVQSLMDNMSSDSSSSGDSESSEEANNMWNDMINFTEPVFATTTADYNISRPFRIGAQASFQPYGPWFTLTGLLGMGCRQPFSSAAQGYIEYDISVKVGLPIPNIGDLIGVEFTTGYLSETFRNRLTFIFNARALELNLGVSTQSSNFATSFALSGANVFLYMAFGW